jgi:hypothetical protein
MLQQAFNGHRLRYAMSELLVGALDPGFCGPHNALAISAGNGGWPLLKHIFVLTNKSLQLFYPQVFLLKSLISCFEMLYLAARLLQLLLVTTWYVWQEPSLLGWGLKLGILPLEQQTCCLGISFAQNPKEELYLVKLGAKILHLLANAAQLLLDSTWIVLHSARGQSMLC